MTQRRGISNVWVLLVIFLAVHLPINAAGAGVSDVEMLAGTTSDSPVLEPVPGDEPGVIPGPSYTACVQRCRESYSGCLSHAGFGISETGPDYALNEMQCRNSFTACQHNCGAPPGKPPLPPIVVPK